MKATPTSIQTARRPAEAIKAGILMPPGIAPGGFCLTRLEEVARVEWVPTREPGSCTLDNLELCYLGSGGSILAVRRNPGGRPSKFTTPAALAVVTALCQGESLEAAARVAGIGISTLYRWLELGRRGDPRFSPLAAAVPAATSAGRTRLSFGEFRAILNVMG